MKVKSTQGLAATRQRLGLTQVQLAKQLKIPKATLSMAEIGERSLPGPALLKLAELELKIIAASNVLASDTEGLKMEQDMRQVLSDEMCIRQEECQRAIRECDYKLQRMVEEYGELITQQRLIKNILEQEPDIPDNPLIEDLKYREMRIAKRLSKCGIVEQSYLRTRIALLSAESYINNTAEQELVKQQ